MKKKRKENETVKEGEVDSRDEVVPLKQWKTTQVKGKGKASSAERREDQNLAEVRLLYPVWDPRVGLEGAAIPWNSSIKEF